MVNLKRRVVVGCSYTPYLLDPILKRNKIIKHTEWVHYRKGVEGLTLNHLLRLRVTHQLV